MKRFFSIFFIICAIVGIAVSEIFTYSAIVEQFLIEFVMARFIFWLSAYLIKIGKDLY